MCFSSGKSSKVEETETEKNQSEINQELWSYYQQNYKPLVQKYSSMVTDPSVTQAESRRVSGQINAEIMKGATTASPDNAVLNTKNMLNLADVKSSADVAGQANERARKLGQQMNIVNIGRGQATSAMDGLDEMARQSLETAIQDKQSQLESDSAKRNAMGSMAGAVAGLGYGLYGRGTN